MNITKTLTDVGFETEEANVYTAALMLGRATITELARKSELKRPSVYNYAESLLRHNLLSREIKGKRRLYVAQNPTRILKDLSVRRANLEKTLPTLTKMYSSARNKPRVEFLENKAEIKRTYFELSHSLSPVHSLFSVEELFEIFSAPEVRTLNQNIEDSGAKLFDLVGNSALAKNYQKSYRVKNHQIRLLPKDFKITTDTIVTNDTVFLVSFKNMMGIKIENEEIADFFKNMFMFIWNVQK